MVTAHIIHAILGFTSTRLGSEVSCPRTLPQKNPEDPVRLEPRTPGLRVKHFTTEPCGTLTLFEMEKLLININLSFPNSVYYHLGELSAIFIKLKIVPSKLFQFGKEF